MTTEQALGERVAELEALTAKLSERLANASEVLGRAAERGKVCPVCAAKVVGVQA